MDAMTARPAVGASLHRRFESQAALWPDRIALDDGRRRMTYRELDAQACVVADRLRPALHERAELVGLCIERSCELIVGMLGILKAGATYVPLDPGYPAARLDYLVQDARLSIVVTRAGDVPAFLGDLHGVPVELSTPAPTARPGAEVRDDDSAYVIYTSGSTGHPKGVVVEHRNVARLFDVSAPRFEFDEADVWTMFHSISFDFSVWEIWGALLYGGRLVIVDSEVARSPARFAALVEAERVTMLSQTPTAFAHFARAAMADDRRFPALRRVVTGGERLEPGHLRRWYAHVGDRRPLVVNMYGITETTVHVTYREMSLVDCADEVHSPIGLPLDDLQVTLTDADGHEVADGEVGEIVVTGAGVARGYLRRPELDAQRFALAPLGPGGEFVRAYRSGDLARRSGGELLYVGRADDQVKVRGFRIELREVEFQIGAVPGIESCMVICQDLGDGDKRLLAFYVTDGSGRATAATVAAETASRLAPHMRPARFVEVPCIPVSSHGKRHGQELMNLLEESANTAVPKASPSSTLGLVAGICSDMLADTALSWDVDLFDQGATSLSLSRILLELNARLGLKLTGAELDGDCSILNIATVVNREAKLKSTQKEIG